MSTGRHPAQPSSSDALTVAGSDAAHAQVNAVAGPPKSALERPLAALRRYKWLIVGIVLAGAAAGVIGSRFVSPEYQVRATVWLASGDRAERNGPIRSAELLNSNQWIELFRSFRIVDGVVRKLALFLTPTDPADHPLFTGFALADRFLPGAYEIDIDPTKRTWVLLNSAGAVVETGTAGDSVGRKLGFKWLLPEAAFKSAARHEAKFRVSLPRETSQAMLDKLGTRLAPGSSFLWLTYQEKDPQLAANTLNTWLGEFAGVAADLKRRNVIEFANILEEQLRYAEKATQDAEVAYQRFRVNTITLPSEGGPVAGTVTGERDPALTSYFEQKIEHDNLRQDRQALEQLVAKAAAGQTPYEGVLLIPSVAQSPGAEPLREAFRKQYELQAQLVVQRQSFTDEYPAVKTLLENLNTMQLQTIPVLAGRLLAQLREREADYETRLTSASKELQQIPPRTIEDRRLSRAVSVSEALYTNLKSRYAEAQLAAASATPDVSVLDTAIAPLSPTSNTAPRVILMGFAGGLALAIGLALLLDMLDRRIRYSEQVFGELGLGIAGTVPRVPKGGIKSSSPEQVLQFVESFRSLRMHVTHSLSGQRLSVAVTSAAPGDGKSLISANLAMSFAETGVRTVLIDGDTRRGTLHRMFGLPALAGLTDFLDGAVSETQVIHLTPHANLSFVPSGRRNSRSPELLASPRLRAFVEHLCQKFDVVIFDTPPLAAGIDGFAISAAAGSVLMVLRLGQTERRLAAAKLAVLDRLPVDMLGAVLNGVPLEGEFQYYAYSAGYSIDRGALGGELIPSRE